MKPVLKNLSALGFGILLSLLIGEGAVRLLAPQPDIAEWFRYDKTYSLGVKPNFHQSYAFRSGHNFVMDVATNSKGFRDLEHDLAEPFEGQTILVVGDSFVFGHGVNIEDRFDTHLRKRFGEAGKSTRVINMGVPGWGTRSETAYARDHFALYKPEIVVIVFCANDPANDRGLELPPLPRDDGLYNSVKAFLRGHSHFYRFAFTQIALVKHRRRISREKDEKPQAQVDAQTANIISQADWERTYATLRTFRDDLLDFDPNSRLILTATAPHNPSIREHLKILEDTSHIEFLDWSPAIAHLTRSERRLPWDGHWNPNMHRIFAEKLFKAVTARP